MNCHECECFVDGCFRLCDGRCLSINSSVDIGQLKVLIESGCTKKVNFFLQKNAMYMMNLLINGDSEDQVICVSIYGKTLTGKHLPTHPDAIKLLKEINNGVSTKSTRELLSEFRKIA